MNLQKNWIFLIIIFHPLKTVERNPVCEELCVTPDYLLLGNIHANDLPQNITDSLRLCSNDDIELVRQFVEILVNRNKKSWNDNHYV